jgi:hypothetical protein
MMITPRRGYTPKLTASNFLQLSESQISSLYLKNTKNSKTTKIEPLNSRIWEGNHSPKNHEGFRQIPRSNPQEQGPENTPRKPPREGSENHHQEQPGTTQQGLEEPRRIIYTYQEGSYKV